MDEEQPEPATRPAGEPRRPRGEGAALPRRAQTPGPAQSSISRPMECAPRTAASGILGIFRAGATLRRGWMGSSPTIPPTPLLLPAEPSRCVLAVPPRVPPARGPSPSPARIPWSSLDAFPARRTGNGVTLPRLG